MAGFLTLLKSNQLFFLSFPDSSLFNTPRWHFDTIFSYRNESFTRRVFSGEHLVEISHVIPGVHRCQARSSFMGFINWNSVQAIVKRIETSNSFERECLAVSVSPYRNSEDVTCAVTD